MIRIGLLAALLAGGITVGLGAALSTGSRP